MQKHSVSIRGHRTSFSLEEEFWMELKKRARERGVSCASLITKIDAQRDTSTNLSSAIRLFVLSELKDQLQD